MMRWIENVDKNGNKWKLSLEKREGTTNRFELRFTLNSKKFVLSRIFTKTQADNTWELIEKIVKEGTPTNVETEQKKGKKNVK